MAEKTSFSAAADSKPKIPLNFQSLWFLVIVITCAVIGAASLFYYLYGKVEVKSFDSPEKKLLDI